MYTKEVLDSMSDNNDIRGKPLDHPVTRAARTAIALAKQRGEPEITPDDLLAGLLLTASRFGIVWVGDKAIDLMTLGVEPADRPATDKSKAAYSPATAAVFDRAALVAKVEGGCRVELVHMLAAYSAESGGLMGEVKMRFGFDDSSWRAALARWPRMEEPSVNLGSRPLAGEPGREIKEFFTPEEAAAFLGLHIQTVRGYVRSGKLPALRVAGERAIRIRREELLGLLEPLEPSVSEEDH